MSPRPSTHLHAAEFTVSEALDAVEHVAQDIVALTDEQILVPADELRFLALRLRQLTRGLRHAGVGVPSEAAR